MSYYRRAKAPGGTFFFTIVTAKRKPLLIAPDVRQALRESILHVRQTQPFDIVAWVLLPDHMHCVWTLPEGDDDYSSRIGKIKRLTSKHLGYSGERDSGLWQRRFWEHQIRDEKDLIRHIEYIFINPVKHGLCSAVAEWPYSSFHRYVKQGIYPQDWASSEYLTDDFGE